MRRSVQNGEDIVERNVQITGVNKVEYKCDAVARGESLEFNIILAGLLHRARGEHGPEKVRHGDQHTLVTIEGASVQMYLIVAEAWFDSLRVEQLEHVAGVSASRGVVAFNGRQAESIKGRIRRVDRQQKSEVVLVLVLVAGSCLCGTS